MEPLTWRDRGTGGKGFLRSPWVSHGDGTSLHPAELSSCHC